MVEDDLKDSAGRESRMIQPIRRFMVVRVWPDEEVERYIHQVGTDPLASIVIMSEIPLGGRIEISAL